MKSSEDVRAITRHEAVLWGAVAVVAVCGGVWAGVRAETGSLIRGRY